MSATQNDTKNLLTALKAYIGSTKSSVSFNPEEIINAISQSESNILKSIDQAVFDKQLLVDILSGTCENLTGDAITAIGDYVFYNIPILKSVDLPNCISIGKMAFMSCTGLSTVYLPNVVTINFSAFNGCGALTALDLPNAVNIDEGAFGYCSSLKKIFISKNCTEIKAHNTIQSPFFGCTNSKLKIYCEASEKPSGWDECWNSISSSAQATVVWGASHEDYEAYDGNTPGSGAPV